MAQWRGCSNRFCKANAPIRLHWTLANTNKINHVRAVQRMGFSDGGGKDGSDTSKVNAPARMSWALVNNNHHVSAIQRMRFSSGGGKGGTAAERNVGPALASLSKVRSRGGEGGVHDATRAVPPLSRELNRKWWWMLAGLIGFGTMYGWNDLEQSRDAKALDAQSLSGRQIAVVVPHGTIVASTATIRAKDQPLTRYAIADAAESALSSVVNITAGTRASMFSASLSTGSGFIVSPEGIVVTNAHVVPGASKSSVVVTLSTGEKLSGKVMALDVQSDIALIKINAKRPLPPLKLGKSSLLRPGEWVVALGSPHRLSNSVSAGIVSAVARPGSELGMASRTDYIQTDTAINHGNSGGPLINLNGEVIGINTMKLEAADGISFSIPMDVASEIIQQLLEKGCVVRPYIGIKMSTVDRAIYDPDFTPRLDQGPERTVMIVHVAPGSPAEKAGLQDGDLIIGFDGQPCTENKDVLHRIGFKVGRPIGVVVQRPRAHERLAFTLVSEPAQD